MNSLLQGLARHFSPEQLERLASARVGVIGAGGLGSNLALMLARSGVRCFTLIDPDRVEASNLNRQAYFPGDVGRYKVQALARHLKRLNPELEARCLRRAVTRQNAPRMLGGCSVVVEAVDRAETKLMLYEVFAAAPCFYVTASGMAGLSGKGRPMRLRAIGSRAALAGDEASDGERGPMLAPRVTQAAALQAEAVLAHVLAGTSFSFTATHGDLMSFTQNVFTEVAPLLRNICEHPFNAALAEGRLDREKFIFYLQQDSLYLVDFARALALAGARFAREDRVALMLDFAHGALIAERALHARYFQEFGVIPAEEKGPACLAYTSYLLAQAATAGPGEALAALLPCFWIYREVGRHIAARAASPNPYEQWIATYSCPDFSSVVDKAVELTDALALECGPAERERMRRAFMRASVLEYCFWDDAEHRRPWPV